MESVPLWQRQLDVLLARLGVREAGEDEPQPDMVTALFFAINELDEQISSEVLARGLVSDEVGAALAGGIYSLAVTLLVASRYRFALAKCLDSFERVELEWLETLAEEAITKAEHLGSIR